MIHLDTSALIRALVPRTAEAVAVRDWLRRGEVLAMTSIAWAEFLCGPLSPDALPLVSLIVRRVVPFDEGGAKRASILFKETGRRRGTFVDCLIAASAIESGAGLATANRRDFERFVAHGLTLAM